MVVEIDEEVVDEDAVAARMVVVGVVAECFAVLQPNDSLFYLVQSRFSVVQFAEQQCY